jgi:hypothetical protein
MFDQRHAGSRFLVIRAQFNLNRFSVRNKIFTQSVIF